MLRTSRQAFTLVELAIVLVIIGLIVGGVLVGQSLIEASYRRAVIRELDSYKAAIHTFQLKYNAIPGDMKNAEQFWGTSCPNSGWNDHHAKPTGPTCNGNGDGAFTYNTGASNEYFNFWHHLQNAGYLKSSSYGSSIAQEGVFAQVVDISGTTYFPNSPAAAIRGTAWSLANDGYFWPGSTSRNVHAVASTYYIEGNYGNSLRLGCPDAGGCDISAIGSALTPLDAYDIDAKIDDGYAGKGNVVIMELYQRAWGTPDCAKNPNGTPAPRSDSSPLSDIIYDTNATTPGYGCTLIFKRAF